jgi:hypothetical protein
MMLRRHLIGGALVGGREIEHVPAPVLVALGRGSCSESRCAFATFCRAAGAVTGHPYKLALAAFQNDTPGDTPSVFEPIFKSER